MPSTPKPPEKVEPGQQWRDNDQRSKGAGEFTIVGLATDRTMREVALVERDATGRRHRIRVDRLLTGPYTYLGRQR